MNLILLGPPGAGKGTQGQRLAGALSAPTISTGDMLRAAIAEGSDLGKLAKQYTDAGGLVPDEVVVGIVEERLGQPDCESGFILDGFPRTVEQARALDTMLEKAGRTIDRCVLISVDDDEVVGRLLARRVCGECGTPTTQGDPDGRCNECNGPLVQRSDDNEETIRARLEEYRQKTQPLVSYYQDRGQLAEVPGKGTVDEIFQDLMSRLGDIES